MKQYRRHLKACPHRHKKDWTRCHCPLWCDGMLNGERYRRSLKTNSWDKGIKKLAALDSAQFGEEKGIREAISAWDTTLVLRRLKPATLRKYRRLAKQLQKWCEKNACMIVGQLTAETIDQFRLSRAHVASLTSLKELQILRSLCGFFVQRGWMRENQAKLVDTPKASSAEKLPYTPEEMAAFFGSINRLPAAYERARARAYILLLRNTGLRISDVVMLRKDRIRNGEIFLHAKKNGIPIMLPLPQDVKNALDALPTPIGTKEDHSYFFYNGVGNPESLLMRAHRLLHSVFLKSKVAGATTHRFRHSLASDLLAAGYTTDDVADVLGISPQIAKKHYIKMTLYRQERIREAMKAVIEMRKNPPKVAGLIQ